MLLLLLLLPAAVPVTMFYLRAQVNDES